MNQITSHTLSKSLPVTPKRSAAQRVQAYFKPTSKRRKYVRGGVLVGNVLILAAVGLFIVRDSPSQTAKARTAHYASLAASGQDPLDQLSSADIAVNLARMTAMPESTAVTNQADSVSAELTVASSSDSGIVTKPQVAATGLKSRKDIQKYTTQPGDTISSIAAKFNVTSDSVRWSNSLGAGDIVASGVTLSIPPVNGIVYTVNAGDTPDSLAQKFQANRDQIIAYNDAEIGGLQPGEQVIIPNGQQQAPALASPRVARGFSFGSAPIYGYNGYDYGFCTWYVASRIAVPSNWGNANTWDNLAPLSGWTVSSIPRPGSIAQTDRGSEGHVAVVEAVSPDGTQIKYSDMNGLAGFGRVGYSGWVPASTFEHYIYH